MLESGKHIKDSAPLTTPSSGNAPQPGVPPAHTGSAGVSREQFAELFCAQSPALKVVAAAILGSSGDAEDVVQEAAVIALSKTRELSEVRSFPAWMTQIVRYVALNARRGEKRRRSLAGASTLPDDHPTRSDAPSPPGVDSHGALAPGQVSFDDRVVRALMGLSETSRACLLLRVVLDMPYKDIARILSIAEGAAMTHVSRARAMLLERLTAEAMPPKEGGPVRDQ